MMVSYKGGNSYFRHYGLGLEVSVRLRSSKSNMFWIPAFAGMKENRQSVFFVKYQIVNLLETSISVGGC